MASDVLYSGGKLILDDGTLLAEIGQQPIGATLEGLEHQAAFARWHQKLSLSRSGGFGALSAILLLVGDSRNRPAATKYRNAWPDLVRRRLLGSTPGSYGLMPASEGGFSTIVDVDWPGGDNPWTYTGACTGNAFFGIGWHGANVVVGGSATITYFGDKITLYYVKTAAGPTACAVTLDGVAQTALNARATQAPGQQQQYGTNGDYGFHTFTVTPNDGTLIMEGVQWFDGDAPVLVSGSVQIFEATHTGFGAFDWNGNGGRTQDWSAMLAGADPFFGMGMTVLDVNDIAILNRTPTQFRDDLVALVQHVDSRLGTATLGWAFISLPTSIDTTAYRDAMYDARRIVGTGRAAVIDLAAMFSNRRWPADLSADGSHPNDAGHVWIADQLGPLLDPNPPTAPPVTAKRTVIDATTPADGRLAWPVVTPVPIAGTTLTYDEATASALRERKHRVWLDAGTYRATISAEHATGRGVLEVLIGNWPTGATLTPTLTSCGTVDTSTPAGPAVTTTILGTSVTTAISGYVPIVIRKTNTATVGRFVQLVLDKTA